MAGVFRTELIRAFTNKRFILVFALAGISFMYGWSEVIQIQQESTVGAIALWKNILWRGSYGFFGVVMAGLPYAGSLLTDRRHHFIDQVLMRSPFHQYLSAKIMAVSCSGAAAVCAPALVLLIVCCLVSPAGQGYIPDLSFGIMGLINPNVINPGATFVLPPAGFITLSLLMLLCFGGLYALLGLGSSFVIRSPYIVLGIPFIVYSLGYYIIPTSVRLAWLGSTEAALLPTTILISPILQYLGLIILFVISRLLWGHKKQLLSD